MTLTGPFRPHALPITLEGGLIVDCPIPNRREDQVYIYAIRRPDTGEVKIGLTSSPWERIRSLQTAHARPLVLAATKPGAKRDEIRLHEAFRASHLLGEWFTETPDITAWINQANEESWALGDVAWRLIPNYPLPACCATSRGGKPCEESAVRAFDGDYFFCRAHAELNPGAQRIRLDPVSP